MRRIRQFIPIIFGLVVFILAISAITHELRTYKPQEIWQSLTMIPKSRKLSAIAFTALGYLSMTGYDWLAFHYLRHFLAPAKIILTSFLSYAIGNTVGFTLFSGSAIRYRLYGSWGVSTVKIVKIIIFTHLAFWLGMFAIGGVVFILDPLSFPQTLNLPFKSVHPLGIIFLGIVAAYFGLSFWRKEPIKIKGEEFVIPSAEISLGLMLVSATDWALAAGVLYLLLPSDMPLSYASFFGIYVLALTAGILSNVPGGLGVFETVILLLRPPSVPAPAVLGALLAYRGIYYFLPLIVALGLLLAHEWQRRYQR